MRAACSVVARFLGPCVLLLASVGVQATPPPAMPPEGNWTMPAGNYASTRFSPLDQINGANASKLKVEFTFSTGVDRGQEAAPIVVGDTMYIVTPFPNVLYALDLSKPGAPVKWKYEPHPEAAAQGVACCDVVIRGAVVAGGKVFFNTLDGNTIALDLATG
jgi:glucose dehydrogenase